MKNEIRRQLLDAADRLTRKGLFGRAGDSFSMRVPGTDAVLWQSNAEREVRSSSLADESGEPGLHASIYRNRADAGAVLLGTTNWSQQLSALQVAPPTLFDEQARHIGRIAHPVPDGDLDGLVDAIRNGSNVALYGTKCLRIGMTRDRIMFNAELFEKCAMAFVISSTSAQPLKTIPAWVRYIAGRRLWNDQKQAADSYARGQIPRGMNTY